MKVMNTLFPLMIVVIFCPFLNAEESSFLDFHDAIYGTHSKLSIFSFGQNEYLRNSELFSVPESEGNAVLKVTMSKNEDPVPMNEVRYWAYIIQHIDSGEADILIDKPYDVVVIEPTRTDHSDPGTQSYYISTLVADLKASRASDGVRRKTVLAYIDIGQAEDWRWYWKWSLTQDPTWPDWIVGIDPQWESCYPVAFWDPDWKKIVIYGGFEYDGQPVEVPSGAQYGGSGYNSVIDEVITDGFDGIYLDWVEAFSDDSVIAAAQAGGIGNVAVEMLLFIQEMHEYGKARFLAMGKDPDDFIIIQQNAQDLVDSLSAADKQNLFNAIDAIACEGVWWEGWGDVDWNDSDGYDIPAPDVQGDADWQTDTLNIWLPQYQNAGIPIYFCEYAVMYANAVYERDMSNPNMMNPQNINYIPYCSRRALSQHTTTPPQWAAVTVADGTEGGTIPMRANGTNVITITWDTATENCTSTRYHLLWGWGNDLPLYTGSGADCSLGISGLYSWETSPDTSLDFCWFLVVGNNGDTTEGGWGNNSFGVTRSTIPSGECSTTSIDTTSCSP